MLKYIKRNGGEAVYQIMKGEILPSQITLSDAELSARLGRCASASDADVELALKEISKVLTVRFVATRVKILENTEGEILLEGFSVTSQSLSRYFGSSRETFMFMITLGSELDRLIMKKRALSLADGFVYDAVASAIIEAACDALEKKICCGVSVKNRFSPGYADCPLSVQYDFARLLSADKHIGIKLLRSALMTPMKSVSAFIAIREGEK